MKKKDGNKVVMTDKTKLNFKFFGRYEHMKSDMILQLEMKIHRQILGLEDKYN